MKKLFLPFIAIFILFAGCGVNPSTIETKTPAAPQKETGVLSSPSVQAVKEETYWPTEGWKVSTPEKHGMSSQKLAEFVKAAGQDINSFVIVKDGYIVAESYFGKKQNKEKQNVFSITKSVMSALFGVAKEEGMIKSLDEKVLQCFPGKVFENTDQNKKDMTLKHLLTMTTGLEWTVTNQLSVQNAEDPLKYVLDKPMANKPGEVFVYNNGASQVLGQYIAAVTGKELSAYAEEKLFKPLGIKDYTWGKLKPSQEDCGFSDLYLTARDMAKFGYLYLNRGMWEGVHIVPEQWVEESIKIRAGNDGAYTKGYGYQWWLDTFGSYSARGLGGQYIIVFPDKNMVIVMQCDLGHGVREQIPQRLTSEFILPAVVSSGAIAEDPQAYDALKGLCGDI